MEKKEDYKTEVARYNYYLTDFIVCRDIIDREYFGEKVISEAEWKEKRQKLQDWKLKKQNEFDEHVRKGDVFQVVQKKLDSYKRKTNNE